VINKDTWELLSYVVTVIGLPLAIMTFMLEQRKERENEDEEVYQLLADNYTDFLKLVMANPDLQLRSHSGPLTMSPEQEERKLVLFEILISLFERAYLLTYDPDMHGKRLRRWMSWEDYMREWCLREDFRQYMPRLLIGEDADFVAHISNIASTIKGPEAGQ
jgi:hypothetical protein